MSETRDAYVRKVKAKLDEWNAEIDKLEAKARQKEAEIKTDYQERIDVLETKREEANDKLAALQSAGDAAWQDLKSGVELAASALGEAVKSARTRFQ